MRFFKRSKKSKGIVYTVLADVLLQLVAIFISLTIWINFQLSQSQEVASMVPGLTDQITGLQGQVEDGVEHLQGVKAQGEKYWEMIGQHRKTITDLETQVGLLTTQNGIYASRFRSGDPITLVVAIDVTQSTTSVIERLKSMTSTVFEFIPNTSKDFRVGVLAFRKGVVARFPITPVLPTYEDNGKSQKAVLNFLNTLTASKGNTDHLPVFREAMTMLDDAHGLSNEKRNSQIIFLGDVGPSEMDKVIGYGPSERQLKHQILREVTTWARKGNRSVKALYAESSYTEKDPSASESRDWFKALGNVSSNSRFYTDNFALLRGVLHDSVQ